MTDDQTTVFAGVDAQYSNDLPTWFAESHRSHEPTTFSEAIRELPQATTTAVAYRNPYSEEWVQTDRHNAIVEPSRLAAALDQDTENTPSTADPLFSIPTNSYSLTSSPP